jgi:hypothetical protein
MKTFLSIPPPQASQDTPLPQDQAQQPSIPLTPKILLKVAAESADDGGKKKKQSYDPGAEMKVLYNKPMRYDNKTSVDIIKSVAQKSGLDPALLYSSAFQEGMNKQIAKPDETEAYLKKKGSFNPEYPVSGYDAYGLDNIGSRVDEFINKGYLPSDFKNNMKAWEGTNDHMKKVNGKMVADPQKIVSADFKNNESALMAKSAFMRAGADDVDAYAKQKGVTLDPDAKKYFMLAAYNSSPKGWQSMMNEYAAAKDKKAFIEKGLTAHKDIHGHIAPRMQSMSVASEFFK